MSDVDNSDIGALHVRDNSIETILVSTLSSFICFFRPR